MCRVKPQIAFDTCFYTFNPKCAPGLRNRPFILRPAQIEALEELRLAITTGHDLLLDKSRDEGATEIICKFYALWATLFPETTLLMGSRKEEYVDQSTQMSGSRVVGSPKTLFHKLLYTWATCPIWMKPEILKSHMHAELPENGSVIDGEATNENFGAGDRRTGIFLDEFGANDPIIATHIRNRVADVSDCVFYVSTHYYGMGHPYGKLRFSGKVQVVLLPWWKNPEKAAGLYKSPDLNCIDIYDPTYYAINHPELNSLPKTFKVSELEVDLLSRGVDTTVHFVADGSNKWRAPWYDGEEARRDPRDVAQNIDMNPAGAGDMFFDPVTLQRIRAEHIQKPVVEGEIQYELAHGKFTHTTLHEVKGGRVPFRWWSELKRRRPIQSHNYVVACDISLGLGQSNSVAAVVDMNLGEQVGMFISSNRSPEEFCDDVMALCYWIGGQTRMPYLLWEANGPGGIFDQRRRKYGYTLVYVDTVTRSRNEKRTKKPGWYSTRTSKYDTLLDLRTALAEGLRKNPTGVPIKIRDETTLRELEDFIFYDNGDVGLTACLEETAGAKAAHGDTVIALALAVKGMKYQRKGTGQDTTLLDLNDMNTPAARLELAKMKDSKSRKDSPWLT